MEILVKQIEKKPKAEKRKFVTEIGNYFKNGFIKLLKCVRACVCVCACVRVFVLSPFIFSKTGRRTQAIYFPIQKTSAQIPKGFHQHAQAEKTML